jgi:hypothetical protein
VKEENVSPEASQPLAPLPPQKRQWEAPTLDEIDYHDTMSSPTFGPIPDGAFYS